jgi:GTP 3',8-cyclase
MAERVIPLIDQRFAGLAAGVPAKPIAATGLLSDTLGRPLRDLRISVTDRCNFRCSYCMPKEVFDKDYPYLPHSALLSFEEITRLAKQFVAHGVRKIRLTGGEPLLRKNIEILIEQLAALRTVDGEPLDITLTTNGSLLARKARSLKAAGLQRVTVSLDGLDDAVFRSMNDVDFPVAEVLEGIAAAKDAGLGPIKINMVVKRGTNDQLGARAALHRVHGRGCDERLAHGRSAAFGRRCQTDPRRAAPGAAGAERARRDSRALGLCGRRRRSRRDQQRDAGFLR